MSHNHECAEDMGSDPCGGSAVGVRLDPTWGGEYPVCEDHHRPPFPGDDLDEWRDDPGFVEHTDRVQDRDL